MKLWSRRQHGEVVHTVLVKLRLMLPAWLDSTREAMLEEVTGSAGEKVRNFDHLSMLRDPKDKN